MRFSLNLGTLIVTFDYFLFPRKIGLVYDSKSRSIFCGDFILSSLNVSLNPPCLSTCAKECAKELGFGGCATFFATKIQSFRKMMLRKGISKEVVEGIIFYSVIQFFFPLQLFQGFFLEKNNIFADAFLIYAAFLLSFFFKAHNI